jgi:hypothetical protein
MDEMTAEAKRDHDTRRFIWEASLVQANPFSVVLDFLM